MAGNIRFGEAVNKYSDDETSKFTGGYIQNQEGGTNVTIDQLDKDMVVMLKDLKVGQFSQPAEYTDARGKKGVRIVFLKSRTEPHRENMRDDYNKIAEKALEEKKNDALENWFNTKISTYYIMVDDDYKNCDEMKKWLHSANATARAN